MAARQNLIQVSMISAQTLKRLSRGKTATRPASSAGAGLFRIMRRNVRSMQRDLDFNLTEQA
jgi:hypothetical protein